MNKGVLLIMSGFSGAGKGTLLKKLLNEYEDYAFSVSMTTRNPRPGEKDGVDYFFVTKEAFEETIEKNGLYEYNCYCGNYYGTPKAYVDKQLNAGKSVILDIDVNGALKIKEKFPDTVMVFIVPPSIEVLKKRLKDRGTETDEVIAQRLNTAKNEFTRIDSYEYIVVNDDLNVACKQLDSIVQSKKLSVNNSTDIIENIKNELKEI